MAVAIYFFHKKTSKGYQMEVIRRGPAAAKYAGMNVKANIIFVLGISGAIAGLAGFAQVGGIIHRVQADRSLNSVMFPLKGFSAVPAAFGTVHSSSGVSPTGITSK